MCWTHFLHIFTDEIKFIGMLKDLMLEICSFLESLEVLVAGFGDFVVLALSEKMRKQFGCQSTAKGEEWGNMEGMIG